MSVVTLEEIRRWYGLRVGAQRREQQLAEFDRAIKQIRAIAFEEGQDSLELEHNNYGSYLSFPENPYM